MDPAAEARPRFLPTLARQLTQPIQLIIPPTIGLLILGQRNGFVADRPPLYYVVLILAVTTTTSIVDVLWPDKTCTKRQMVYRTATMLAAITVAMYTTGWGPTLAVGYGYALAYAIRYAGSAAAKPMMITTVGCLFLGQVAIAIGLAPTLIPQPLVHGLALLIAAATVMTIWFQGIVVSEKEELERTVREQKEELAFRANHDALTQLPNRTAFLDRLEPALSAAHEHSQSVAVLFLDVDSFKTVNDTLGHAVGDRLLTEVAGRVRSAIRPGDIVARFGGDEFTVLLENVRSVDDAKHVSARITDLMRAPMQLGSHEISVTVSIGIGMETDGRLDADEMLATPTFAMYVAKKARRTRPDQPAPQSVSSSQGS